jgi:hypothetical protein
LIDALRFWKDTEKYRKILPRDADIRIVEAQGIAKRYLSSGSFVSKLLDDAVVSGIEASLRKPNLSSTVFSEASRSVYDWLNTTAWSDFLRSNYAKQVREYCL